MTVASDIDVWALAAEVLTAKQRRVLELRGRHGMSIYSIDYALDQPSTVRGHIRAASRNLRRALEAEQIDGR